MEIMVIFCEVLIEVMYLFYYAYSPCMHFPQSGIEHGSQLHSAHHKN